jgi:hypothetical protein
LSKKIRLNVVRGHERQVVGSILAQVGMLTNHGEIESITPTGRLRIGRKYFEPGQLTVRHSEAYAHGYPFAEGCCRSRIILIRRGGEMIAA